MANDEYDDLAAQIAEADDAAGYLQDTASDLGRDYGTVPIVLRAIAHLLRAHNLRLDRDAAMYQAAHAESLSACASSRDTLAELFAPGAFAALRTHDFDALIDPTNAAAGEIIARVRALSYCFADEFIAARDTKPTPVRAGKMWQPWFCETCAHSGGVAHLPDADVYTVIAAIDAAHAAKSGCGNAKLRVLHDAAVEVGTAP